VNAVSEGDNGTTSVDVTVRRDVSGQAAIVALSLTGTANEEDRVLASESVSFEVDEMQKVVQLMISGDTEFEPDESVIVSIVSISESATVGRQSATVTITNDDLPEISLPVITLAVAPLTAVLEDGSDALIFTFTRKGSTVSPLGINYAVAGTATLGIDYSGIDGVSTSQAITFAAGEDTVILTLDSIADRLIEPDEIVSLTLIPGEGYTVGTTTAVSGTIRDDDASWLRHSVSTAGDDSFTLIGGSGGTSRLKISLACAELDSPGDLALFTVDDLQGRINGIDPSDPAYARVALSKAYNVFSIISNLPQGFNPSFGNRVLELNSGDHFRFLIIKNGTLDTTSQQPAGSSDVFLSNIRDVAVSQSSPGQFILSWKDSLGNGKIRDLRIAVEATDEPIALGSKLQDNKQGEVLDLSGVDSVKQVRASFVVNREADYNNVVGFYKITDSLGTITDPLTGSILRPGDSGYAQAALRYRVSGIDLQVANQSTATSSSILMQGGSIFAPFIVANGSPEQILDSNPSNDVLVYFPFIAANSDGIDHIRLLADNTFGFEDIPGGGDLDYNDMIIAASFAFV
jgi:glycerophosphoryl diester phosphodiesterase